MTTIQLLQQHAGVPMEVVRALEQFHRSIGRYERLRSQVPELVEGLALQARIESAMASSLLEGIRIESPRALEILSNPTAVLRTKEERELAGYRDAAAFSAAHPEEECSTPLVLMLHHLLFARRENARTGSAVSGSSELQRMVAAAADARADRETWDKLEVVLSDYRDCVERDALPRVVAVAALALDVLLLRPFQEGNGRIARLLVSHCALAQEFEIVRFVSIEKLIEERSAEYYQTLLQASQGWADGSNDPWPWVTFLIALFDDAYARFALAASDVAAGMSKQTRVRRYILEIARSRFTVNEVALALPGVSDHTVRLVLKQLRIEGLVRATSVGRNAQWVRIPRGSNDTAAL